MTLSNTIIVGLKEVWAHKFRSLLTMLGIILGVASLVGMAAIIKGMENGMRETMIAMGGADRVNVDQQDVPAEQEHLSDQAPGNTMADVEALRGCAPLMRVVSPKMDVDDLIVTHGDKTLMVWDAAGVWPAALEVYLYTVEHGRFFTDLDEENANPVCVIGTGIRDELFGSPEQTGAGDHPPRRDRQPQRTAVHHRRHVHALRKRAGQEGAGAAPRSIRRQRRPAPPGAEAGATAIGPSSARTSPSTCRSIRPGSASGPPAMPTASRTTGSLTSALR